MKSIIKNLVDLVYPNQFNAIEIDYDYGSASISIVPRNCEDYPIYVVLTSYNSITVLDSFYGVVDLARLSVLFPSVHSSYCIEFLRLVESQKTVLNSLSRLDVLFDLFMASHNNV